MDDKELFQKGKDFVEHEQWNKAIEPLNRFIEKNPNHPQLVDAFKNRGIARLRTGDSVGVIEDLNRAITLQPNNPELYNILGKVYQENEKYDHAIENYEKALEIDSNNESTVENLATARALQSIEQERKAFEKRIKETYQRIGGFRNKYQEEADKYEKREKDLDGSIRKSVLWLSGFIIVLSVLLIAFTSGIMGSSHQDVEFFSGNIAAKPFALLPWILLIGLVLSPLAWRILYIRAEKQRNELLKLDYQRRAYLEDGWLSLNEKEKLAMRKQLMEHWMEKSPAEILLTFGGKGDSRSSPLTPTLAAITAAVAAAVRRNGRS